MLFIAAAAHDTLAKLMYAWTLTLAGIWPHGDILPAASHGIRAQVARRRRRGPGR